MFEEAALGLLLDKGKELLAPIFADIKTFAAAKAALREKYERIVEPADYDFVAAWFQLGSEQIVEMLAEHELRTPDSLRRRLKERMVRSAQRWTDNRPETRVIESMAADFADFYVSHLARTDVLFNVIAQTKYSEEILRQLAKLDAAAQKPGADIIANTIDFLFAIDLPVEILRRQPNCCHLVFFDVGARLTQKVLVSLHNAPWEPGEVLRAREMAEQDPAVGQRFLVLAALPEKLDDIRLMAGSLTVISQADFLELLSSSRPADHIPLFAGEYMTDRLQRQYNVRDTFIEPDAVGVILGAEIVNRYFSDQRPAFVHLDEFLRSPKDLLFVIGNYGSGKSAFCTAILGRIKSHVPVLVPMRELRGPEDIPRAIAKAQNLARRLGGTELSPLIILDGIDELPNAMGINERKENFHLLYRSASPAFKLIVTVRSSYLHGMNEFWQFFQMASDSRLWNQMAGAIAPNSTRTKIAGIMLTEFNTEAVVRYVHLALGSQAKEKEQAFFDSIDVIEDLGQIRRLLRTPLYLYIMIHLRPWLDPQINCLGDLVDIFIRFWLARDTEKGRSRWLLSERDRLAFAQYLARKLHERGDKQMGGPDFERIAREYLNHVADADERERMILDLRTTGIFACVGEMVTFAAPLFHDYLVAEQLRVGTSIKRLPTLDQCKLLLGRLESGRPFRFGGVVEESPGFHCESLLDTTENRSALRSAGIEVGRPTMGALALARRRYVFDSVEGDRAVWKTVDGDRFLLFRALLTFRIGQGVTTGTGAVTFTVINRLGLHSRPAGFLCRAFSELIKRKGEGCRIGFTRDDESVGCSIMSLLMLAAGRGAEIRIDFEGCSQDEVEQALEEAGAHRANIEAENLTAGKWLFHGWDGRDHEQLARIAKKAGPTKS